MTCGVACCRVPSDRGMWPKRAVYMFCHHRQNDWHLLRCQLNVISYPCVSLCAACMYVHVLNAKLVWPRPRPARASETTSAKLYPSDNNETLFQLIRQSHPCRMPLRIHRTRQNHQHPNPTGPHLCTHPSISIYHHIHRRRLPTQREKKCKLRQWDLVRSNRREKWCIPSPRRNTIKSIW